MVAEDIGDAGGGRAEGGGLEIGVGYGEESEGGAGGEIGGDAGGSEEGVEVGEIRVGGEEVSDVNGG